LVTADYTDTSAWPQETFQGKFNGYKKNNKKIWLKPTLLDTLRYRKKIIFFRKKHVGAEQLFHLNRPEIHS